MLQKGNSKLGKDIWTWSLPAAKTCPGLTKVCHEVCYALKGFYIFDNVKGRLQKNLRTSRGTQFAPRMIAEIQKKKLKIVRVHVSGDFYSARYIKQWIEIVKNCPDTVFFAYTRSWRTQEGKVRVSVFPLLLELAKLPNMRLWLSCDRDTGAPPYKTSLRRAYMSLEDGDEPKYAVDLVFRTTTKTVQKRSSDGTLVCPVENGSTGHKVTCSTCAVCWKPDRIPKKVLALT